MFRKAWYSYYKDVLSIFLLLILIGCDKNQLPVCNIDIIREQAILTDKTAFVVVSGLDVYRLRESRRLKRIAEKYSDKDFFLCDSSIPQNLLATYFSGCDTLPAIIRISRSNGNISTGIRFDNKAISERQFVVNRENSLLADLQQYVSSKDTIRAQICIHDLDSLNCQNPYFFFLASLMSTDDTDLIKWRDFFIGDGFLNKKEKYLLTQMPRPQRGDASLLLMNDLIDLKTVSREDTVDVSIPFINIGVHPLIVYDYFADCSCIKVDLPHGRTAPGESGVIKVKFHSAYKEEVNQSIILFSNSLSTNCITLKAKVK